MRAMTAHVPLRKWGQNFLLDRTAAARIVAAAGVRAGDTVLEIGPGRGMLTALFLEQAPVIAVEIDPRLADELRGRFAQAPFTLIERDVLTLPFETILAEAGLRADARVVVAGNLPYNISKPMASRLVAERARVARAVLMFQREVADRLVAVPSTRAYGPLAVLAQEAFHIERVLDLPPRAFRPAPKVVSSVTRWTPRPAGELPPEADAPLRATLAAAFAMRRRTIGNNLRQALGDARAAEGLLRAAGIAPDARAEALARADFRRLARLWPAGGTA